ncbi:tetratricopeptide repeat protein [Primorskyibacter sp. S187A]|uniref:tetratricopeptide repeat protein n=1 Tax=Primorskyibacter sp. S187A TaxID=3415130 RepID=UPI003C7CE8DA
MQTDSYGNTLTTSSAEAIEAYNEGLHLHLSGNYGAPEAFERATTADPGFAAGHIARARALMTPAQMAEARAALAQAQSLTRGITDREAAQIAIMARLFSGDAVGTRHAVKAHVADHPRDALIAQLCTNIFGLIGFSGKVGREADLLAYTTMLMPHYRGDWWMMSMHALALCETGQPQASLELMEDALALNPRNAQASHFKAHAQYEMGQTGEGRTFLDRWMADYDPRSILHGHLNWHLALWALQDGDLPAMWGYVDDGVCPDGPTQSMPINVLTDTAAIYHRAELAGHSVAPGRWHSLSDYAALYFPNAGQSFADMHAALAHAMAGEGERLARLAEATKGFAADMIPGLASAWSAIARQDWQRAVRALTPIMATTERIGGSRAQRDLLELTYANALMRMGQSAEAHRVLATRRAIMLPNPPLADWGTP